MDGDTWQKKTISILLGPFQLQPDARQRVPLVTAVVRIAFGLIVAHQFSDVFGFAVLEGDKADYTRWVSATMAALGITLALGFLTPLCLIGLIIGFSHFSVVANLGNMVSVMLSWTLLFHHAGKSWSIDAFLDRALSNWTGWIGQLMPNPVESPVLLASARFFAFTLFWVVCVQAMFFHFDDAFWQNGQVLQVALVMNYFNDNTSLMSEFRELSPSWYVTFCCVGILIQGFWELFVLPLMYSRWTRVFVFLQGVGFFLMCLLFMNLQYLPIVEFCLWALLFGPFVRLRSRPASETSSTPNAGQIWVGRVFYAFIILGAVSSVTQMLLYLAPAKIQKHPRVVRIHNSIRKINWNFGVFEVSVFNRGDLAMGETYFVLYEVDDDGKILRLVPYEDAEGGRLRYLRNDLLYFNYSLRWQRSERSKCFTNNDLRTPTDYTLNLIRRVALLDALLAYETKPRRYRVDFYEKQMLTDQVPAGWSPSRHRHSIDVTVSESELANHERDRKLTFDLPPGHQNEARRSKETLERGAAIK